MTDRVINLILRIQNQTGAVLSTLQNQYRAVIAQTNALNVSQSNAQRQTSATANSMAQLSQRLQNVSDNTARLENGVRGLVGAFAGLAIIQTVKYFADVAARTEVLGTVLHVVANNAGITNQRIDALDRQVQKLGITATASREALTAFIQAGLDINKAAPLARAAQDLAVLAGKNSSELFRSIITNVQQLDTVGLRYNGVVLDMEQVTNKFAAALGKTGNDLTRAERQQAVLNGVLEKAAEVSGAYEASMNNVGKQVQSLKRVQEEAADSLGKTLLPAYSELVAEYDAFLRRAKLIGDSYNQQGAAAARLAAQVRTIARAAFDVTEFIIRHIDVIAELVKWYVALRLSTAVIGTIATAWKTFATVLGGVSTAIIFLTKTLFPAFTAAAVTSFSTIGAFLLANPVGLAIVALTGIVTAGLIAWNRWKDRKTSVDKNKEEAKSTEELSQNLVTLYNDQRDAITELARAKAELAGLERTGNTKDTEEAKKKVEEAGKRSKEIQAEIDKTEELIRAKGGDVEATKAQIEANKKRTEINKALQSINEDLKELKLASQSAMKGLDISTEYEGQLGRVSNLLRDFERQFANTEGVVQIKSGLMQLALKNMAEGAKSFDEITASILKLQQAQQGRFINPALLTELIDTQRVRANKVAIDELNKVMEGYLQMLERVKQHTTDMLTQSQDSEKFATTLRKAFAEIGAGSAVAINGMVNFTTFLGRVSAQRGDTLRQEIELNRQSVASMLNRFQVEETAIQATQERRAALIQGEGNATRNVAARIVAIEREAATQRLENNKKLYSDLRSLQENLASQLTASVKRIADFEVQTNQLRLSREEALSNIRRQGLSDEQKRQEDLAKFALNRLLIQEALNASQNDEAKRLADQNQKIAESFAQSVRSKEEEARAINLTNAAYDDQQSVVDKLKTAEQARARTLTQQLNEATAKIDEVSKKIDSLSREVVVTVGVDESALSGLRQRIIDSLQNIPITFRGTVEAQRNAEGGHIRGPGTGTSDDILSWLSNGEYVQPTRAVEYYGVAFMDAIKNLSLPKYAEGGAVGNVAPPATTGDTTNLYLTIGSRRVGPLKGSRDTIRDLVDGLKSIEGGVL